MLRRILVFVGWSLWFASGAASAASLTWTISGGQFADGGTLSGTLEQDSARARPTAWNVSVAGGGSAFIARSYTPENSIVGLLDWPPNTVLTYHFIDTVLERQLRLTPAAPLDGSLATVPFSFLSSEGAVECFNCAPYRNVTAGSFVLTSAIPTLTLLSIVPDPTVAGAPTTATISLAGVAALGPPTGSVVIYDSVNTSLCTVLVPASTSCAFTPTTPGGQTLHAVYFGDAKYGAASSNPLSFSVVPAAVTTVTLAPVVPDPTAIGTTTTASVVVAPVAGYPPPTGLITVYLNASGSTLCTITLPATSCTFAPAAGGVQTVGSQYGGDANYASGFSNLVTMTAAPVPPAVSLVSLAPNATAVGTATTATVSVGTFPSFGPPTGTITVFNTSGNVLCSFALPATACTFTPTAPGNQTVIARYDGDANYDSGLSNALVLVVRAPSTIDKAFVPPSIPVSGTTTLTFTLTNPNSGIPLTGVAFTDPFPAGLAVAALPNASTVGCGSPTFAPLAGNTSVSFSGGGIAAGGTCTVTVNVTASASGLKNNVTSSVTSNEGGTGGNAAAILAVIAPPTIGKSFVPPGIAVSGTTTLTFTLRNTNLVTALTGVAFTDPFPAGLAVAATPSATTAGCGSPAFAPVPGNTSVSFSGGTIAPSGTCTATVNVTATTGGLKANTTTAVASTEGGTGGTAVGFLVVVTPGTVAPPTIAKSFGAASIVVNGTTSLTFVLTNPNASPALTGVSFTDVLPAGLAVADGSIATCGGTLTTSGGNTITLSGATIAGSGTCTFSVTVTGTTAGTKDNLTGTVSSAEEDFTGGTASATLAVVAPEPIPTLSTLALAALAVALGLLALRRVGAQ